MKHSICTRASGFSRAGRAVTLAGLALLFAGLGGGVAHALGEPHGTDHQLRVRVRVRVLEWQLNNQLDTGFTLNYLRDVNHAGNNIAATDATFPNTGNGDGLTAFFNRIKLGPGQTELAIQALEDTNRLKVLSEPVLTLNAKNGSNDKPIPAKFFSGREIPYETLRAAGSIVLSVTEFRETGITLNINEAEVYEFQGDPNKRFIRMNFHVDVSRPGQEVPTGLTDKGQIITQFRVLSRDLSTTLFIPEHSPFIAGIIKSRTETTNTSGIPFLSEIPIVGALFRSNNKQSMDTELIFMVTADVLWPDSPSQEVSAPAPSEPAPGSDTKSGSTPPAPEEKPS